MIAACIIASRLCAATPGLSENVSVSEMVDTMYGAPVFSATTSYQAPRENENMQLISDFSSYGKICSEGLLYSGEVQERNGAETDAPEFTYNLAGYVKTIGQNEVPVYVAINDYTESEKQAEIEAVLYYFPAVNILGDPTSKYNCHSYAWYQNSINNPYWIEHVGLYANDTHTAGVDGIENAMVGDIVLYLSANNTILHSAIIDELGINGVMCVSKWGSSVLCKHEMGYIPSDYCAYGGTYRYVIVRKTMHRNTLSYTASTHTYSCRICSYSLTEPHVVSITNYCRICGYSGPMTALSLRPWEE